MYHWTWPHKYYGFRGTVRYHWERLREERNYKKYYKAILAGSPPVDIDLRDRHGST